MYPAVALFAEERTTMEATLAAFATGKIKACSDLGAAGKVQPFVSRPVSAASAQKWICQKYGQNQGHHA
jgi:hypothetical protein